jgi:hypothetical protein
VVELPGGSGGERRAWIVRLHGAKDPEVRQVPCDGTAHDLLARD